MLEPVKVKYANGASPPAKSPDLTAAAPAVPATAALRTAQEMWAASPNGEYWEEFARRLPEERAAGSRPARAAAREL